VERETDEDLLDRLRAGDEQAFVVLVRRHHTPMIRLATSYVPNRAVAEEVVQETWLAVLRGLSGFEGRSLFRTWLFGILINKARACGVRERRTVPVEDPGPAVDSSRFDDEGHWRARPDHWIELAEDREHAAKIAARIRTAVGELPARQAEVVTLRDLEGLDGARVCELLGISEGNQRVLLHRGRSRLRQIIEDEFGRSR
jgi:RNA polymerase sigma-70 factor (ECF subfamily)